MSVADDEVFFKVKHLTVIYSLIVLDVVSYSDSFAYMIFFVQGAGGPDLLSYELDIKLLHPVDVKVGPHRYIIVKK